MGATAVAIGGLTGRPTRSEAADCYLGYIEQVGEGEILGILCDQRAEALAQLEAVSDRRSRFRYAPGKWSVREVLAHVNECERIFTFRALWLARGIPCDLPGFDERLAAVAAADRLPWRHHLSEFRSIRAATVSFFTALPAEAWLRGGTSGRCRITVRALAYIIAGHATHHLRVLRERYE